MQITTCDAVSDPLSDVMHGILRHPAFDVAALTYVGNVVNWRKRLGLFNRVGTNLAFHVINYTLYLHLASRAGTVEHGATFTNILAICEARGQCGGRALRTVLAMLRVTGQLRTERLASDGRVQVYVPSDRILGEAREIYGYAMAALDALLPDAGLAGRMREEPTFLEHLVSQVGAAIIDDGVRITEHFPELDRIINRAGGLPTTATLALAEMSGAEFPTASQLAGDFRISASQVRAVVKGLDEAGLIGRSDTGQITHAKPLASQHKGLLARELALHAKYALNLEHHFR